MPDQPSCRRRTGIELNLTSMIDVIFLLLIFCEPGSSRPSGT